MRLFHQRRPNHETAWKLLPWLAQGSLEGRELRDTLDHLKGCRLCREELRFLPELRALAPGAFDLAANGGGPDPAAAFARLSRRLDGFEGPRHRRQGLFFSAFLEGRSAARLRPAGWAALLLILVLGLGWVLKPGQAVVTYRVLSDQPPAGTAPLGAPKLRVVFAPEATEQAVRRILLDAGAELAGGPSPTGVYTLRLRSAQGLPATRLEQLRELEEILFLEPVVAPGGISP